VKKREGLEALKAPVPPIPMSDMLLIDWYAGMALMECAYQTPATAAVWALDRAEAVMAERTKRGL
jgi:hypothetical protein